jgi:DNA-binding MarR family transcriptional regulator
VKTDNQNASSGNFYIHDFPTILRQTYDAVFKLRQRELRELGLTPEQSSALMAIDAIGENATAADVSRFLFRESNTMSVLLRRMEKMGLIKKTSGPRGTKLLSLTANGQTLCNKALDTNIVSGIFSKLAEEKQKQLWALLEELRNSAIESLNIDVDSYLVFYNKFKDLNRRIPGKT